MAKQIHWFPGHMNKALIEVENKIKLVDVVIELLDARAPFSSINENLEKIIKNKKTLIVLTKDDLADPKQTKVWIEQLKSQYSQIITLNLKNSGSENILTKAVIALGKDKWEKQRAKGMKPQPIRAMILGVPNVGKSSLINRMAKRKAAGVQNKPGFTRGEQWIKVSQDFLLMDTPGILPMNYEDQQKATKLALIGSIREDILPNEILVDYLLNFLKDKYPNALKERFDISEIKDKENVLHQIANKRKLVDATGQDDLLRAEVLLLKEFKDGLLGKITLEHYES
ncbi:MAG: ribosome biogenesis GTPase YlqF [Erysipelotrichaceae bacterium]|jgi:ribosome biogenesis GTPase A|nr:ribosome biogenesis GTPase YlqF [Erysipelotrichaceae bacterium]